MLLSSDDLVEAEVDTVAPGPLSPRRREVRSFHALKEECTLEADTLFRFRDKFQFPEEVRIHLHKGGEKAYHFLLGEVFFYKAAFQCGFRFPVHPHHGTPEPLQYCYWATYAKFVEDSD